MEFRNSSNGITITITISSFNQIMNLNKFISENITNRAKSMFEKDIVANKAKLEQKIKNKSVLVIGGAGSIGSSFIRSLLRFKPKSLIVVDINENALTELTRDIRSTRDLFVPKDYITYPMSYADPVFYKMFRILEMDLILLQIFLLISM